MMYAPCFSCDGFAGRHNCATQLGRGEKVFHRTVQASPTFACSCPSGWPALRRRAKREDKMPDGSRHFGQSTTAGGQQAFSYSDCSEMTRLHI